ncbi:hypothetical protein GCM10022263_44470 [Nocardioides daeguensis]|uniref:Uncharacterized protein n=1 Tax=Nocardioides daeguensis TaxID=908359 RepID=A0ABP6WMP3_9ACTN
MPTLRSRAPVRAPVVPTTVGPASDNRGQLGRSGRCPPPHALLRRARGAPGHPRERPARPAPARHPDGQSDPRPWQYAEKKRRFRKREDGHELQLVTVRSLSPHPRKTRTETSLVYHTEKRPEKRARRFGWLRTLALLVSLMRLLVDVRNLR